MVSKEYLKEEIDKVKISLEKIEEGKFINTKILEAFEEELSKK